MKWTFRITRYELGYDQNKRRLFKCMEKLYFYESGILDGSPLPHHTAGINLGRATARFERLCFTRASDMAACLGTR